MWMDALKKCTVEDKMRASSAREAVGRTNGRSVADAPRGSGGGLAGRRGWVEACVVPGYVM